MCLLHKDFSSAAHSESCVKYTLNFPDPRCFRLIFLLGMSDLLHPSSPVVHKTGHQDNGNTPNSNGSGIVPTLVDIVGYDNKME